MTRVNDIDPDATDLIARIFADISLPVSDQFTASMTFQGSTTQTSTISMTFRFRVMCAANYFSLDCTVFCEGRNDSLGHFTCDANGDKVCLNGYTNPATDCVTRKL